MATLSLQDILNQQLDAIIRASAAFTTTANSDDQTAPKTVKGVRVFVDVTAASGTNETLNIKVQNKDPVSEKYFDMPGAAFVEFTATGQQELVIYPGVGETANVSVSDILNRVWRLVYTIGGTDTPTFTFSVGAEYLF